MRITTRSDKLKSDSLRQVTNALCFHHTQLAGKVS